jgi:CBS domain-containing protein
VLKNRDKKRRQTTSPVPAVDGRVHAVAPEVAVSFLKETMPFKELSEEALGRLALHCKIDFYPKGTRIMTYNESEVTHLYLIQRGGVRAFITDEDGEIVLKDYRGVGANVGALGIIRGTRANLNIETVEDTFCFLIPAEVFKQLVQNNLAIAHYYLKSFSDNVVATAYSELRKNKLTRRSSEELFLFNTRAGELSKPLFSVSASTSIQESAAIMARQGIGSLLVYVDEDPGSMIGIVTDTDFRGKVIAAGRDFREPVSSIMSSPLKTVPAQMLCFDVLLKMMTTSIHHLGVEQAGRITGVITSHDIMVQQGNSPYYLFKEIAAQNEFEGLYLLSEKVSGLVRNIINEGAKANNIARMIALINEKILAQILTLLHRQLGPAPVKYSWLLFGSEGRGEQTFKTDQDNGIVYCDPEAGKADEVARYFSTFGEQATYHLMKCGYPSCPDNSMASNPQWCRPLSGWKQQFADWIDGDDYAEQSGAAIFFDFRHGYGTEQLAVDLRDFVMTRCGRNNQFVDALIRHALSLRPPLSFFKHFLVEQNGDHRERFNIKVRGLSPFVDFARVLSLRHSIRQTHTLTRLKRLRAGKVLSGELYEKMIEAFEMQMQVRVIHQLSQIEKGVEPDDVIYPEELSDLEKRMLKDSFEVISQMHEILAHTRGAC